MIELIETCLLFTPWVATIGFLIHLETLKKD